MGWLAAIKGVLAALPRLLDLIEKAHAYIDAAIDDLQHKKRMRDYEKADEKAQGSKDTSDLERAFNGGRK